jgi:hypothetical protein
VLVRARVKLLGGVIKVRSLGLVLQLKGLKAVKCLFIGVFQNVVLVLVLPLSLVLLILGEFKRLLTRGV